VLERAVEHRRLPDQRVFQPVDWLLFGALTLVNAMTVAWLVTRVAPALGVTSLLILVPAAIALAGFEARWCSLPLMRVPLPAPPPADARVAAITTFVPGVEPLDMLRRTVAALVAMEGPHDTWVLDEGDDPEVRRACDELGARHFSRRHRPEHQQRSGRFESRTKHGNVNAWLDAVGFAAYDVVVAFDPDHVPRPSFLTRTLGHLADDEVGYVQAAQVYYNQPSSLVARGAAEETYAYYSSIQMAAHAVGHPIVTGCHTVHRVAALREVGGFAPHEADDLLITLHYRAAGWRGVYVPEVLAAGITPVDWRAYAVQQRRWARSVIDIKLRRQGQLVGRLPLVERVAAAIHGLYYLYAVGTACSVATLAVALATGWRPPVLRAGPAGVAASAVLLGCDLLRQRWFLEPDHERGLHLRAPVVRFAKWPFVLAGIVDALRGPRRGYATTPKVRGEGALVLAPAHAPAVAVLVVAAAVGAVTGHVASPAVAVAAAGYLALTALVLLHERRPAPDPYDEVLAAAKLI